MGLKQTISWEVELFLWTGIINFRVPEDFILEYTVLAIDSGIITPMGGESQREFCTNKQISLPCYTFFMQRALYCLRKSDLSSGHSYLWGVTILSNFVPLLDNHSSSLWWGIISIMSVSLLFGIQVFIKPSSLCFSHFLSWTEKSIASA